jgi:hypothetical protein
VAEVSQFSGGVRSLGLDSPEPLFKCDVQPVACIRWQGHRLGVTENLYGLLGGVYDDAAVLAFGKVFLDFGPKRRIEQFIEIICEFGKEPFALHEFPPR